MSLKHLANNLAAHGRHGDTELVHMSKDEVKALHGLASIGGTRLTRNPHTGLEEAFNLSSLIPIAAGVAGSFVGMPWLGAVAAGALTAAQTGSLEKGLVSGLGSYALGGLGGAALGAGSNALASTAAEGATQAGTQAATEAASTGATQGAADTLAQTATGYGGTVPSGVLPGIAPGANVGAQLGTGASGSLSAPNMDTALSSQFPNLSSAQIAQATSEGTPDLMAQRASMMNQFGQANYAMNPTGGVTPAAPVGGQFNPSAMDKLSALGAGDYMNIAKENPGAVLGAGSMLMNAMSSPQGAPQPQKQDYGPLSRATLVPDYYTRNSRQFAEGGLATLDSRYACGGMVSFDTGGQVDPGQTPGNNQFFPQANMASPMYSQATQVPMERSVLRSGYEQPTNDYGDQTFAQGGLASLQGRALRGPGDGMSDNIPATIEGKQPARLADGEYVVPADGVSHIGNGSTEAGTRKLDQMMSRIRKARTGNAKQGKQINANKFMPA